MTNARYETGKAPAVTIADCAGDLIIKGWLQNAVQVRGEHTGEEGPEALTLNAGGSLTLWVPVRTALVLQSIAGDAMIKGVEGGVQVVQVMGDLAIKNLASAQVTTIHGDFSARNVDATLDVASVMGDTALRGVHDVNVSTVHGDLAVRYAEGNIQIDEVGGDIALHTVSGDVTVSTAQRDVNLNNLGGMLNLKDVHGDVRLKGGLAAGKHHCTAQGDIVIRWPLEAPVNLEVSAARVVNRLPLQDVVEEGGSFSGRIGDGETTLILEAMGRVVLKEVYMHEWDVEFGAEFAEMGADLSGLGEQISSEIGERMAEFSAHMQEHFGPHFAQTMAEKAAKRTEQAVKRAVRHAEKAASTWAPPSPRTTRQKSRKASTEEQLKILGMLEKGIISVEEAETLLKALEE